MKMHSPKPPFHELAPARRKQVYAVLAGALGVVWLVVGLTVTIVSLSGCSQEPKQTKPGPVAVIEAAEEGKILTPLQSTVGYWQRVCQSRSEDPAWGKVLHACATSSTRECEIVKVIAQGENCELR